jgi:hypothetical protein
MLMLVGSSGGGLLLRPWLFEHGRLLLPAARDTPRTVESRLSAALLRPSGAGLHLRIETKMRRTR